jgi:hypothetical protein
VVKELSLRLVPDAFWEIVEPLVPESDPRPATPGRRDRAAGQAVGIHRDRVRADQRLRPGGTCQRSSGSASRPRTGDSPSRPKPVSSARSIARCSTGSVPQANWTGRRRSWTRPAFGQKGGHADRPKPRRPRQIRLQASRALRSLRNSFGRACFRGPAHAGPSTRNSMPGTPRYSPVKPCPVAHSFAHCVDEHYDVEISPAQAQALFSYHNKWQR